MKQLFTLSILVLFTSKLFAQCTPTDTVSMGALYANDVFYSMKNKVVKTVSNNNWHIAFSVQKSQFPTHPETGVAIRVNSVKGNVLVKLPGANAASWRTIDTTGLSNMPERLDSFKTWDISAFTKEYNITTKPFDFIWGTYNNSNYNVEGTSVFVLYNKTANMYKKIFVKECSYDTMWQVIMSNIDNSDSVYLKFSKSQFPNRLFAYYDMVNKQLIDREPAKTDWDIVWTRYKDVVTQFSVTMPYPLTGILSNKGVTVAKNVGKKCNEVWQGNITAAYSTDANVVGWDWKFNNMGPFVVIDTFVYFIKAKDAKTYKMSFNAFTGSGTGTTILNGKDVTSVKKVSANNAIQLYPNPSNGLMTIATDKNIVKVTLIDNKGSMQTMDLNNNTIDISGLANGIYLVQMQSAEGVYTSKIIKE